MAQLFAQREGGTEEHFAICVAQSEPNEPCVGRIAKTLAFGEFGSGRVLLKPAPTGTGIIAGGSVRKVLEAAGIKNIRAKCLRSSNPINVVKATFEGLAQLRTAEEVAALRGLTVDEIMG